MARAFPADLAVDEAPVAQLSYGALKEAHLLFKCALISNFVRQKCLKA